MNNVTRMLHYLVAALKAMDQKDLTLEFSKNRLMDGYNKRKGLGKSLSSSRKPVECDDMHGKTYVVLHKSIGKTRGGIV